MRKGGKRFLGLLAIIGVAVGPLAPYFLIAENGNSKQNNEFALSTLLSNTNIDTDMNDTDNENLILNRIKVANSGALENAKDVELSAQLIKSDEISYVLIYGLVDKTNDTGGIDSYVGSIYVVVNIHSTQYDNKFDLSEFLTNTDINTSIEENDDENLILSRIKKANEEKISSSNKYDLKAQLIKGSEINYVMIYGIVEVSNDLGGNDYYIGSIYFDVDITHSHHNNTLELSTVLAELNFTDTIEFHDGSQLAFDHLVQKLQSTGYDTTNLKMSGENSTTNTSFTLTGSISKSNSAGGIDTYVANDDVVQFTRSPESKHNNTLELSTVLAELNFTDTIEFHDGSQLAFDHLVQKLQSTGYDTTNLKMSGENSTTNTSFTLTGSISKSNSADGIDTYVANNDVVQFTRSPESKHNNTLELSTVLAELNFTDTIEFHDGSQLAFDHLVQKLQSTGYDTTSLKMSGENSTTSTSFTLTGSVSKSNSAGGIDTYVANNDVVQFTRSPEAKHDSPLSELIDPSKMTNLSAIAEYDANNPSNLNNIWMKYIYEQFDDVYQLDFDNATNLVFEQATTDNLDGGQKLIVYGSIKVGNINYSATKDEALEFTYTLEGNSIYKNSKGESTSFNPLQDLDSTTDGRDRTLSTVGYYEKDGVVIASHISKNATAIDDNLKMSNKVTSISGLFANVSNFKTITLSTSTNFDTSNVTDMSDLFASSVFTSVDIRNLKTNNVQNLSGLFKGCSKLITIRYADKLVTASATNISYMFYGCSAIGNIIDFDKFDTSNVTDMSHVFDGCKSFTHIEIDSWDTSKVTDMTAMFKNCVNTNRITFYKQTNTSNVKTMESMFEGCKLISKLDFGSVWDTSNVTNMSSMFKSCSNSIISALNNDASIAKWNVSNVTDMSSMFSGCGSNTYLDLSAWAVNDNVIHDSFSDNWNQNVLPPFKN